MAGPPANENEATLNCKDSIFSSLCLCLHVMDAFLERQIRVPVLVTGQRRLESSYLLKTRDIGFLQYRSPLRIGGCFALEATVRPAAGHRCARWLTLPRASAITGDACEWATCVAARPTSAHCHGSIMAALGGSNISRQVLGSSSELHLRK